MQGGLFRLIAVSNEAAKQVDDKIGRTPMAIIHIARSQAASEQFSLIIHRAELMGKLSGEMDLDILGIIRDDRSDSVTDESE